APVAVVALRGKQIIDAGTDSVAVTLAGGEQREQGPGGLRGRRCALAGQSGIVVTAARLAPSAAGLLHFLQPGHGAAGHRVLNVEADAVQTAENLPGAIKIIDAPAADPAAGLFLRFPQESESAADLWMIDAETVMTERFEDAGGDVGTARIEHGIVVGEG